MRISIIQPSYIPWLGYLYMVRKSDIFVYYDNVQYDKGGWRNRNKVVCGDKVKWLSLSLSKKDMDIDLQKRYVSEIKLSNLEQFNNHRQVLYNYYPKKDQKDIINRLYPECMNNYAHLSDALVYHNSLIFDLLDIKTKIYKSSELDYQHRYGAEFRNSNLIQILSLLGATRYISGLAAKSYINTQLFDNSGIKVEWNDFNSHGELKLSSLHYLLADGRSKVLKYLDY